MPTGAAADKRLRLSFDARSEAVRRAVHIAAAMSGRSHNDVLNDLIREHLGPYLALAQKAIDEAAAPARRPDQPR